VPGSLAGAGLAGRIPPAVARRALGVLLLTFSIAFLAAQAA